MATSRPVPAPIKLPIPAPATLPDDRAKTLVVRALHFGLVDLLDHAGTNLDRQAFPVMPPCEEQAAIVTPAKMTIKVLKTPFIAGRSIRM
jgi:hypothetical protein